MPNIVTTVQQTRWTRSLLLRLFMVPALVLVGFFYWSVSTGESRHNQAVTTLGRDATTGIIAAQRVKSGLAEMNGAISEALVPGSNAQALVANYALKRQEVSANLVLASEKVVYGRAQELPLESLQYVLPSYHTLVTEALAAHDRGDNAGALDKYNQASDLMVKTLMPAADALDKANTYALNETYNNQQTLSNSTRLQVLASGAALLAVLILLQVFSAVRFHRAFSVPLVLATILVGLFLGYSQYQFTQVGTYLTAAKDDHFDSVHVLWRARAVTFEARRQQTNMQLDPAHTADYKRAFNDNAGKVIHGQDGAPLQTLVAKLRTGQVTDDIGGYFATELRNAQAERATALDAVASFARYADGVNTGLRSDPAMFTQVVSQLDATRDQVQSQFAAKAGKAASALGGLALANILFNLGVAVLILVGVNRRIKIANGNTRTA